MITSDRRSAQTRKTTIIVGFERFNAVFGPNRAASRVVRTLPGGRRFAPPGSDALRRPERVSALVDMRCNRANDGLIGRRLENDGDVRVRPLEIRGKAQAREYHQR